MLEIASIVVRNYDITIYNEEHYFLCMLSSVQSRSPYIEAIFHELS